MHNLLFIPNIGPMELVIIFLLVLLLFGGRKIPQLARDLGSGIREFRKSISGQGQIADVREEEPDETERPARKKASRKS
ncbi:MAG: twin-arginine translocase TatA/TatE family subunit [Spirochaetales bacterium]|nr:twin-arginine translocase TatA/TatE family subunit [Spirochaetales bacterium]